MAAGMCRRRRTRQSYSLDNFFRLLLLFFLASAWCWGESIGKQMATNYKTRGCRHQCRRFPEPAYIFHATRYAAIHCKISRQQHTTAAEKEERWASTDRHLRWVTSEAVVVVIILVGGGGIAQLLSSTYYSDFVRRKEKAIYGHYNGRMMKLTAKRDGVVESMPLRPEPTLAAPTTKPALDDEDDDRIGVTGALPRRSPQAFS